MADTNPCLPQKGLSAFSGDCRLKAACTIKQYAQYCAPNGVAVQNCSFFKTSWGIFTSCLSKFAHSPRLTVAERLQALVRLVRRRRLRWLLGIGRVRGGRQRWPR